jgi:hypothetical protein
MQATHDAQAQIAAALSDGVTLGESDALGLTHGGAIAESVVPGDLVDAVAAMVPAISAAVTLADTYGDAGAPTLPGGAGALDRRRRRTRFTR